VLVLAFWVLAFSRAGDACSVDSLIAASRTPETGPAPASGEYTWPVQLILTALSLVFFAAGVAKIWASGSEWVLSDHMAILLRRVQYHISDADPLLNWGSHIAELPLAPRLLAATTILVETSYPLSLFSRRLRVPLVLGGMGLILGIRFLMGPTFEQFLVINTFWVPWDRVAARLRARYPARVEMTILYDGLCGFCRPTVAVLRRLDIRHRIAFLDVEQQWPAILEQFPRLTREACLTEMHAVDREGRVFIGFDTYRELARLLPLGWLVLPFLNLPPVRWAGRRIYRAIADRRHRTACALPLQNVIVPSAPDSDAGRPGPAPVH
jgi:predicted DCC family thiol-disulfide oxidoreductase YuxK